MNFDKKIIFDFDHEFYKKTYDDIKNLNNEELEEHYLNHGIKENRIYKYILPDDFNSETYKKLNIDLQNLNKNELEEHYLNNGIKENRKYKDDLPENFYCNIYKKLNKDLINMNNEELINHYLYYGIKENRIYIPENFDCNIYKKLNKDLINMDNKELINHYLDHGIKENRKYKDNSYINLSSKRYDVAVILPTLNRLEKFKNTVKKIINQTFKNFQLIIIDDGSNDNIFYKKEDFLKEINDSRIYLYRNNINLKIPKTLNKGLSYSNSKYITWISDDNDYYDNFIELLYDENYDYIYSAWDFQVIFNNEPHSEKIKIFTDYKNIKSLLRDGDGIWNGTASFMWNTNFLKEIYGWNENYHGIEDYEIVFKTFLYTTSIKKIEDITGMCYYDWKEFDINNNIIDQNGLTGTEGLLDKNKIHYQEFKNFYYNNLYLNNKYINLSKYTLPSKIPKIAFTFWHGEEFTYLHYLSIETFCFYNRDYEFIIYTIDKAQKKEWEEGELSEKINCINYYNKINILQDIYNIKIINLKEKIYRNYCPNIISDLVRWNKLYEHGGIWLDLDILHLKPIEHIFKNIIYNCDINNIDFVISNYKNVNGCIGFTKWFPCGIIFGSKNNNICKKFIDIMYDEYDPTIYNSVGPDILKNYIKSVDNFMLNYKNVALFEPNIVYPYVWNQTEEYCKYNILKEDVVAIHWYNGSNIMRKYLNNIHTLLDNDKSFFKKDKNCMELYINKFLNEKRVAFRSYKICLVIDSYGWAHNIMAINIKKALSHKHLFFIYTTQELIDNILNNDFDIKIIDIFFLLNSYDPNILSGNITLNSLLPKEKVVHWICDYSSWINHPDYNIMINGRKMLLDMLNSSSITFLSCDKIEKYLNEINIYPKNKYEFEYLVDLNLFTFSEYNLDILTKNKINIGWAGNASPNCHGWLKGLDNIKNVITKNSDKFNLIYYNKFEDKYLNYDNMPYFYRDIDIYICFSKYEGTPNTILEASSSGRAWISTDVGNISKMINFNNNCGIIINRSEEDLENALLDLYNNRNKIVELGKNARNVIENNFNYINISNNCFNKIFDILY